MLLPLRNSISSLKKFIDLLYQLHWCWYSAKIHFTNHVSKTIHYTFTTTLDLSKLRNLNCKSKYTNKHLSSRTSNKF